MKSFKAFMRNYNRKVLKGNTNHTILLYLVAKPKFEPLIMPKIYTKLLLTAFSLLFLVSCQNDDAPTEPKSNVLFSVDLANNNHAGDIKGYIAAYTPDGELLNYGSLGDSLKWDLKAKYNGTKIDIVYFDVLHGLTADHFKNISVGQTFTDPNLNIKYNTETGSKIFNFKVEDFGNRIGNSTADFTYMNVPFMRRTGYAYWGDMDWDKIENGYGYQNATLNFSDDPKDKEQGLELIMFERGTNIPYIKYFDLTDLAKNNITNITLNKSDFTAAQAKIVEINAISNDYANALLYTYNSKEGRRDIITSFDHHSETGNKIYYISSTEVLPTSYWKFSYSAKDKNTSYAIKSNKKEIPSTIAIKDLKGQSITKNGNQFTLTHAAVFPDKKLVRSYVTFYKYHGALRFDYTVYFDSAESVGTAKITPLKLPTELLKKYNDFITIDSEEWKTGSYGQVYTNIPNNSPLDYLKNSLIRWSDNDKANSEYSFENFSIAL